MNWLSENTLTVISLLFGTGSIGYAVVTKALNEKKYIQEVRDAKAEADMKGDEFWKKRYDVLQNEVVSKDTWWKSRYDTLYSEYQNERKLSNDIIISFRTELNEMRDDYDKQRDSEKKKYVQLMEQYRSFEEESEKRECEYKKRISQLESLVSKYEERINTKIK